MASQYTDKSASAVVGDVSDTARWVAYYRALESERPDALFHDPLARRLAGERGQMMAERMAKVALPWAIAVRTRVYDELLLEALIRDRATVVVDMAAGMDARPYRLDLPRSLHWIELDLPQIMEAKSEALANQQPACSVERIGLDLADGDALGAVLDRVLAQHSSAVVVTEGVLAYLDDDVVAALARNLHARPAIRSWVLEAALPEVLKRSQRAWGKHLQRAGAAMKFAPSNGLHYFQEHGWSVRAKRSCLLEARRLQREPRFAGLLHLMKSLTATGREWLQNVVVYGVVERSEAAGR
jgi:methyltransferase (TIGR00027 family)